MADRSVLIVDDEIYIRMTLSFALEKLNFSVDTTRLAGQRLSKSWRKDPTP